MLKIIKKVCVSLILLASHGFASDPKNYGAPIFSIFAHNLWAHNHQAANPSSTANQSSNDRFTDWTTGVHTRWHSNAGGSQQSAVHQTVNSHSVIAHYQQLLAYTADIQKVEIASLIQSWMKELPTLLHVQIDQKIMELHNHLTALKNQQFGLLNELSRNVMHIPQAPDTKVCVELVNRIEGSLAPQQKLEETQKIYQHALTLKKIEVQISAYEKVLEGYQQQAAHIEAKLMQEFKPKIDAMDTQTIVSTEISQLKNEIATIEAVVAKHQQELKLLERSMKDNSQKQIELEATMKDRLGFAKSESKALADEQEKIVACIKKNQHEIASHKEALLNAQIKLKYAEDVFNIRHMKQRFQALSETQVIYSGFWPKEITAENQELLNALNTATFEQGNPKYKFSTMLHRYSQRWLMQLGINPQKFVQEIGVDALQRHLFITIDTKFNEAISQYMKGTASPEMKKYMDAMASVYSQTVDAIRTGTPQMAIAAFKANSVSHKAALTAFNQKNNVSSASVHLDTILTSTAELAQAGLDASKRGQIERSLTIAQVANEILDCVTSEGFYSELINQLPTGVEASVKGTYEGVVYLANNPIEILKGIALATAQVADIIGQLDEFSFHRPFDKAQIEAITTRTNNIAHTLNEVAAKISGMSPAEKGGKIGLEIGKGLTDAYTLKTLTAAIKTASATGKLAITETRFLLSTLETSEIVTSAKETLIKAEERLAATINAKNAEVVTSTGQKISVGTGSGGTFVAKEVQWTSHGFRHAPPRNVPWKEIVKQTKTSTPKLAKYKHGINIEALERTAWEKGIPTTNGRPWKVMKFDEIIGATNGVETSCIRIEINTNTIHGHPITPEEYLNYIKK